MPIPWNMVYVPTGFATINGISDQPMPAFLMEYTEVTNGQYKEYLQHLQDESLLQVLGNAYPDTTLINRQIWISKKYPYFEHEMFNSMPVVGLSLAQMEGYARWKTGQLRLRYPGWKMGCRLPSRDEWMYAARADKAAGTRYTFGNHFANSKGCYLMWHFTMEDRRLIYGDSALAKEELDLTGHDFANEWYIFNVKSKGQTKIREKSLMKSMPLAGMPVFTWSYFPNDYGLYNMSGNVAELVYADAKTVDAVGGSFRLASRFGAIDLSSPYPFDAAQPQVDIGFRLVCDYEPPQVR